MTRRLADGIADEIGAHMTGFFRSGVTRCAFARAHARESTDAIVSTVHVGPLDAAVVDDVESFLDGASDLGAVGVVVLPELRAPEEICALLDLLGRRPRWRVAERKWKAYPRPDVLVGVWLKTRRGDETSVMGLAPLGTMPAMRRAPYVAITAWTGGFSNPFWTTPTPGRVGLVNMPLPGSMKEDAYEKAYASTKDEVDAMKRTLEEGAARPDVAFCLPSSCREALDRIWTK